MDLGLVESADRGYHVSKDLFADGLCIKSLGLVGLPKEVDDLTNDASVERGCVPLLDLALGIELG